MLLSEPTALLLACVMSILFWPLQQATTIIYRGCAYRAVVGKEQALWFCLADNLCAMFHCQDKNVFSLDDCGCVPPHPRRHRGALGGVINGSGRTGGVTMTTAASATSPSSLLRTSSSSSSSLVLLSGGKSLVTSPLPPTFPSASSSSLHATGCRREIHIDGLSATRVDLGPQGSGGVDSVYIEPRGVIDMKNGSALYNGFSSLSVPMYASADFDAGITVELVLLEDKFPLRQVLMTNCKHGEGASVEVLLDVELGVILFHVMYRFREPANAVESGVEVAVPYRPFVAKRVALSFDGHRLTGRVNNSQRSASVQGHGDYVMARRAKPLMFGNTLCDVDDVYSYRGQITQISVSRCARNFSSLS